MATLVYVGDAEIQRLSKTEVWFDSLNQLLIYKKYIPFDSLWRTYTFKYDQYGRIYSDEEFDKNGQMERKILLNYDRDGNLVSRKSLNKNGELIGKEKYEYKFDKHGNWIHMIRFVEDHPFVIVEREITYF